VFYEFPDYGDALLTSSLSLRYHSKATDCVGRVDNSDILIAPEFEQMAIARDDDVGLCCQGGGDDVIIVWIGDHHAGHLIQRHQFDGLDVIGEHLSCGAFDQRQPLDRHRTGQHVSEFVE